MTLPNWKLRARVFLQRMTQPTCACMICMTAPTFANVASLPHWKIALQTGVVSGLIVLATSYLIEDRGRRVREAWARIRGAKAAR